MRRPMVKERSNDLIPSLIGGILKHGNDLPKKESGMRQWFELYHFQPEDRDEIQEFIEAYPFLKDFLPIAAKKFIQEFGGKKLELRKVVDYEFPEETCLLSFINTDLSVEEATQKVLNLYEDWFVKYSPLLNGRFTFNVTWSE